VPADSGTSFCLASDPARPSTNTIGRKRPINMHRPRAVLYQVLLTVRPAKADPLLLVAEVNA
jgi:hypothetical protein